MMLRKFYRLRPSIIGARRRFGTMQTARVGKDKEFAYIDSGPLESEDYTTLVCVHGHTYHAQNFARLLPLAHKHNLRIIALNRRDYVGSTPFSPAELAALNSPSSPSDHPNFLQARGLELAQFLAWVAAEKRPPRASVDGKAGGLALMGWSLGNVSTLAFLAHLRSYPREVIEAFEPYLRTFFLYEVAYSGLGYPPPKGVYHPLTDASIPEEKRAGAFGDWVSSYYTHPAYAPDSLSSNTQSTTPRDMSTLQVHQPTNTTRLPTLSTLTPAELCACVDPAPGGRSEQAYWGTVRPTTLFDLTRAALLHDPARASDAAQSGCGGSSLLPELKVRVVYGLQSLWSIQWGAWALQDSITQWTSDGARTRPVDFVPVARANHFLHWDDPELFMTVFSDGISS